MSRSLRRRITVPFLAVLGVLAVPLFSASPASAASCSQLRENQRLTVTYKWRYRSTLSRVDNTQLTERTLVDKRRVFGRVQIGGATCKENGTWRVVEPFVVGWSSVGLTADAKLKRSGLIKGWGLGVRSGNFGTEATLDVQTMHCGKGNFYKNLKTLIGIPFPKVDPRVAIALWTAGLLLPDDKQKCGNTGVSHIRISASNSGELRVKELNPRCCREEKFIPAPGDGWNSRKQYAVQPVRVTGP